jgi:hypothetical protein
MNAASSTTKGIANAVGIVTLVSGSKFFTLHSSLFTLSDARFLS